MCVSFQRQRHGFNFCTTTQKNFLFIKNATKPNAYWDIVALTAFLQDEGHENDKKDPIKQKLSFNMLLKIRCANWQI
jgi:hypothetical protein